MRKGCNSVIVIGGNHHNTLGVIRSLGRKGVRSCVILTNGDDSPYVLKSKYINQSFVVNGSEAAIDVLLNKFAEDNSKPVLIACHDVIASLIDSNRERLMPFFVLPGCEQQGKITELMDKKRMGEVAAACGFNIPYTVVLSNADAEKISTNIPFPCITKPIASRMGNKSEIHVCKNVNEFIAFFSKIGDGKKMLIQQFIEKTIEFQLIGCSVGSGEHVIIPGVSIILRQPSTTNTGFLHYKSLDDSFVKTVENTRHFIQAIGYSGLFSVEFLRDTHGTDYFMEINFRNDGNAIAVTNAGVNLPYIWYLNGIGCDFSNEIGIIHDEFVMPEFAELSLLQNCDISLRQWSEDMTKATSYMDFDPEDMAPTNGWKKYNLCVVKSLIKYFMRKIVRCYDKFKKTI